MTFPIPSFSDARKAVTSFATGTATGCELICGLGAFLGALGVASFKSEDAGTLLFRFGVPCGVFGGLAYSSLHNSFDKYTLAATAVAVVYGGYKGYNDLSAIENGSLRKDFKKERKVETKKEALFGVAVYSFVAAVVSEGIQYAAECYSASRS